MKINQYATLIANVRFGSWLCKNTRANRVAPVLLENSRGINRRRDFEAILAFKRCFAVMRALRCYRGGGSGEQGYV
jgi:hypothetical protein